MNARMSAMSSASEPYSTGSEGKSTTSCTSKLLCGEYGTSRRPWTMSVSSKRHSPSVDTQNRVRCSCGRYTISTSAPSSRTSDTVGWARSSLTRRTGCDSSSDMSGRELAEDRECFRKRQLLDPHQERDDVPVRRAAEAMKGLRRRVDHERRRVILVKQAATGERVAAAAQRDVARRHRLDRRAGLERGDFPD